MERKVDTRIPIIGIMGPGEDATKTDVAVARIAGEVVSESGYILLTGGRDCGVMEAAMKSAKASGGKTVGILPDANKERMSQYVDIPIVTGIGNARNIINILTSDVIIAIGKGPGTFSEIALAVKNKKPIIVLNSSKEFLKFLGQFSNSNIYFLTDPNKNYLTDILRKIFN
ncbi:MAG: LOG family protein [Bacteroidales bacterium]|nr:LOG family protein [Bacteroidales bacterium]